jgi:hypothetical protein
MEIVLTKELVAMTAAVVSLAALSLVVLGYTLKTRKIERQENDGEAGVRKLLTDYCSRSTAHLLNNVTLPYKDGTTQIDHILLTQNGILVIETKHYTGWLFVDENQKHWTQVIYRLKHRFQNPIHQNLKHVLAVRKLLDFIPPSQIQGLVVFTGDAEFKTEIPGGVIHISELEAYADQMRIDPLSENRLQFCVGRLECKRLELTGRTDIEHQRYLEDKFGVLG